MARKDNSKSQPNAPELQQLYHQPPHNPYYPDLNSHLSQPPPYSELTVPNSRPAVYHQVSPASMSRGAQMGGNGDYPRQVVIQQVPQISVPYDSRSERYHRRVRAFNNQTCLSAILAGALSYISLELYKGRPCIFNFTVHKLNDKEVSIDDLRNGQTPVLYLSVAIALICLIKGCTGRSKSYSCYLFCIAVLALLATILSGYMAYLCYWTTCEGKVDDIVGKVAKTAAGLFSKSLPNPENRVFGETNVFTAAETDTKGLLIFVFNSINFLLYFAMFLSASFMC